MASGLYGGKTAAQETCKAKNVPSVFMASCEETSEKMIPCVSHLWAAFHGVPQASNELSKKLVSLQAELRGSWSPWTCTLENRTVSSPNWGCGHSLINQLRVWSWVKDQIKGTAFKTVSEQRSNQRCGHHATTIEMWLDFSHNWAMKDKTRLSTGGKSD